MCVSCTLRCDHILLNILVACCVGDVAYTSSATSLGETECRGTHYEHHRGDTNTTDEPTMSYENADSPNFQGPVLRLIIVFARRAEATKSRAICSDARAASAMV